MPIFSKSSGVLATMFKYFSSLLSCCLSRPTYPPQFVQPCNIRKYRLLQFFPSCCHSLPLSSTDTELYIIKLNYQWARLQLGGLKLNHRWFSTATTKSFHCTGSRGNLQFIPSQPIQDSVTDYCSSISFFSFNISALLVFSTTIFLSFFLLTLLPSFPIFMTREGAVELSSNKKVSAS